MSISGPRGQAWLPSWALVWAVQPEFPAITQEGADKRVAQEAFAYACVLVVLFWGGGLSQRCAVVQPDDRRSGEPWVWSGLVQACQHVGAWRSVRRGVAST